MREHRPSAFRTGFSRPGQRRSCVRFDRFLRFDRFDLVVRLGRIVRASPTLNRGPPMFTIGPERAGRGRSARLRAAATGTMPASHPGLRDRGAGGCGPSRRAPPQVTRIAAPDDVTGFGGAVVGLGDVDGDGVGDVAVGAGRSGHAYVITGDTVTILHDIASPLPGLEFGAALAAVGDVDRDGVGDLAVGAPPEPPIVAPPCPSDAECVDPEPVRGHVFVISGASAAIVRQWATNEDLDFGRSVSGPGDLSGDGVPDVVVGAPGREEGPGAVRRLLRRGRHGAVVAGGGTGVDRPGVGVREAGRRHPGRDRRRRGRPPRPGLRRARRRALGRRRRHRAQPLRS